MVLQGRFGHHCTRTSTSGQAWRYHIICQHTHTRTACSLPAQRALTHAKWDSPWITLVTPPPLLSWGVTVFKLEFDENVKGYYRSLIAILYKYHCSMVPRIVGTGFARMLLLPATRVGFYDNNSSWDAVSTKVLFTRVLLSKRESPITGIIPRAVQKRKIRK